MGRELKRGRAPVVAQGSEDRRFLSDPSADRDRTSVPVEGRRAPGAERAGIERPPRWFATHTAGRVEAPARRRSYTGLVIFIVFLATAAVARGIWVRALLPIALAAAAITIVLRRRYRGGPLGGADGRLAAAAPPVRRRGLSIEASRLSFESGGSSHLVATTSAPFGVTLISTRGRDRIVAAITSGSGAFYVAASVEPFMRRSFGALLARASTSAPDEAGLEATGPDGEPLELTAPDLAALVDELLTRDPGCLDRIVLSDARGAPLLLDAHELRVGERRFDLSAPLEWRAFVFQEPFGQAVAVYQATSIRQGLSEVVLVSLLPSLGLSPGAELPPTGIPELDRAASRDLRLLQAPPELPPPLAQRVAIDRLFMLPLRCAIDRARTSDAEPRARA